MTGFANIDATFAQLRAEVEKLEQEAARTAAEIAMALVAKLCALTPVWSGETVRNYALGVDAKPGGGEKSAIGGVDPGPTNSMRPMGGEPRRPANTAATLADARAALQPTKLVNYHVTNTVAPAKWDLVENGSAPTKERARYPGGVSTLAEQSIRAAYRRVLK